MNCRGVSIVGLILLATLLVSAGSGSFQADATKPTPVEVEGLHNVFRVSPHLYSGSGPEDAKSFAALAKLGVKTVISVDGARPKVEAARKEGLRYVHLPIGYSGVPRERLLQLAKAMQELPGPFYIHCHHGKHRGPAAAAVARLCADEQCTVAEAMKLLKAAGTDERYKGLFESVEKIERPKQADWKNAAPLVEAMPVAEFTQVMVKIDQHFDHLKLARGAGWKTPKDHPDVDPAHEALQLVEHYQELRRQPAIKNRPGEFQDWLREGETTARALEQALRKANKLDVEVAERAFKRAAAVCAGCHAKYRD